ncbi:uncharacterized protein RhoGEF3 isoform X2 [Planococcus citri]|uniref:uncharacterized protein RhoGEF3 isoform X2 n=1 Tax=Planococcus citri TaxID=170843 RepID=UPI0031F9D6C5
MKSGGPNVSVLHLRSTSEPWMIANEDENVARNLKLIFNNMDAGKMYRDIESSHSQQHHQKHLRENECQPLINKQPLPLPRRYINRAHSTLNGTSQQNYLKSKSTNECSRSDSLIIEPPRRFSNEYEKELEMKLSTNTRRKLEKDNTLRSLSYYPILSPPPGFQDVDGIEYLENSENINPTNKGNGCGPAGTYMYPDLRSKTGLLNARNGSYYRTNKGATNCGYYAPSDRDKIPPSKSNYRRRMTADYAADHDQFNNRFKSESFNDKVGGFSSWRSESDPYPECSQYSYNCYCNHCRVGSVPSTLSHSIAGEPSYLDAFDDRGEQFDTPSIKSYHSYEPETPRRQKIRRAASFQARCANTYYLPESNGVDYFYGTQARSIPKNQSRNRYASFDDAYHDTRTNAIYSRSPNSYNYPYYYYNDCLPANNTNYNNRFQDCSCSYPNSLIEKPVTRKMSSSSSSIPIQGKNRTRYDDEYPIITDVHNQLYEEIYPTGKDRISHEMTNPPDIANISSYSRLENHNAYDPEFIRKQPDILQSAYYGSRCSSSLSTDPAAGSCLANYPTPYNDNAYLEELKRKSYSLPKSFQRNDKMRTDIKLQDNPVLLFHWRKHGIKGLLLNKKVAIPPSVMSETAPTTPIKDMPEKKKYGRLMKVGQYSSTPSLDDNSVKHINFDCDNKYRRDKFKNSKTATLNSADFRPTSQENIVSSSNLGDRVFHKFCKSFSLRFLRKPSDAEDDDHKSMSNGSSSNKVFCEPAPPKKSSNKFGPLAWRTSKERKNKMNGSVDRNDEIDSTSRHEVHIKDREQPPKLECQQRIVRRTLSDLNGYCDIVKDKHFNATVPTKYKPPVPVVSKKHRQYNLRRTASQPLLSSRFSPALERKPLPSRAACSEDERALFSEDDMMSDSGSSVPSRKNSLEQGINEEVVIYAEAVWDHVAIESEELPFNAGDVIEVYNVLDREWWWGMCNGKSGWFPSDFVRLRVNQEETLESSLDSPTKLHTSLSIYSNDQVRSKIVCELISTERDFVKVLKDVKEAYIIECRNAKELFTMEDTFKIFGNWEQILAFQVLLLENLDLSLDSQAPHKTCVGNSFLKFQEHFRMYSDYCNNHPLSIATLQQLYQKAEYRNFFEKCRIKKNLIEIPLDGFLLTPIQRICKYPLQLAELLKYTESEHPDYDAIRNALNAMREVAVLINERKRRMESLEKLILWQQRIEGWEGDNLIENSSQLIHQNDVTKVFAGVWSTNVTLFLFDHQLVFCKKDILKRDFYMYKGRISLDNCEVIDIADGKDSLLGINIRHGIKIQNIQKNKWLLFSCRTHKEKLEWLEAFKREKELVLLDERNKLQITPVDRHLAYITATTCNSRHTFLKHKNKKFKRSFHNNGHFSRNTGSPHILGRKVGTWFMFGANRKNHRRINTKSQITSI